MRVDFFVFVCSMALSALAIEVQLPVEYSVDGSTFRPLGSINLRSRIDGNFSGTFKSSANVQTLHSDVVGALKSSGGARYFVRSGDLLSSNLACHILLSNLKQEFAVTYDQEKDALRSLTVFPLGLYDLGAVDCADQVEDSSPAVPTTLETKVAVAIVSELPVPETAAYLKRLEEEKRARQHGATQDNRSFLAKYWMYIVPFVLFMVISGAMGGEESPAQ